MFLGACVLRAQDANLGIGKTKNKIQQKLVKTVQLCQNLSSNIYQNFLNIFFLKIWEFFISVSELLAG